MSSGGRHRIRRATAADQPELARLLARYKTVGDSQRRFEWIYRHNPDGEAASWIATGASEQVVGFTSIYPRTFRVNGERVLGSVGFDAFVLPECRRQGIAAALHRASAEDMASGEVPFRFMCGPPAPANLGALLKIGARVVGPLRVHVRSLSLRGLYEVAHYKGPFAEGLGKLADRADALVGPLRRLWRGRPSIQVRPVDSVGELFDAFDANMARQFAVVGRRDAAFARWRYLQNPVCRQELMLLEERGEAIGWIALEFAPHGCLLVDFALPEATGRAVAVLLAVLRHAADRGASRAAVRLNPASSHYRPFLLAGFLPGRVKEQLQVLSADDGLLRTLLRPGGWHFTSGDLNPEATHWSVVTSPREAFSDANFRL